VLLIEDKAASGTTHEEAVTLTACGGLARDTNAGHGFVADAMG
jgi:hypothetical protein